MIWANSLLPDAFARAFAEIPDEEIWEWADREVTLVNEDAAEPGPYRSAKTPHTRRIQELIRNPMTYEWDHQKGIWVCVQVTEINEMKSSQSGISEACLNGIRWKAKYRPVNTIYAIDTADEAKKIARRVLRSLKLLDPDIFTGDPDDIKTLEFLLRGMELLFYGSFSSGKFANKQSPFVISDELEEHGESKGDTSTQRNISSRKKTADDGLQINISKPKKANGPIHQAFKRGNQEEFFVRCPHCDHLQYFDFFQEAREIPFSDTIDEVQDEQTGKVVFRSWRPLPPGETRTIKSGRIAFSHCKDLTGRWDKLRILSETAFECAGCEKLISEEHKASMAAGGIWLPMAIGTPGIISQHIHDFFSSDKNSSLGRIVLEYLDAKREGRRELQGWHNHRRGREFSDEVAKTGHEHIRANIAGRTGTGCPPYRRGTVPFEKTVLVLGGDVGGNYARWAITAVHPNMIDSAVVDWGEEIDPAAIGEIMIGHTWTDHTGKRHRISYGFIDAKYRKTETYRACLSVPGRRLIPCAGIGGTAARVNRVWSYNQMPSYPKGFCLLSFNDRDAKDELYLDCIRDKTRRVWFPLDVEEDPRFMDEMCAEELIEDDKGRTIWNPYPPPNHSGDTVKMCVNGLRFLTRKQKTERKPEPEPV